MIPVSIRTVAAADESNAGFLGKRRLVIAIGAGLVTLLVVIGSTVLFFNSASDTVPDLQQTLSKTHSHSKTKLGAYGAGVSRVTEAPLLFGFSKKVVLIAGVATVCLLIITAIIIVLLFATTKAKADVIVEPDEPMTPYNQDPSSDGESYWKEGFSAFGLVCVVLLFLFLVWRRGASDDATAVPAAASTAAITTAATATKVKAETPVAVGDAGLPSAHAPQTDLLPDLPLIENNEARELYDRLVQEHNRLYERITNGMDTSNPEKYVVLGREFRISTDILDPTIPRINHSTPHRSKSFLNGYHLVMLWTFIYGPISRPEKQPLQTLRVICAGKQVLGHEELHQYQWAFLVPRNIYEAAVAGNIEILTSLLSEFQEINGLLDTAPLDTLETFYNAMNTKV